jgi:arabinosaccharide transport system permease protein
VPWVFLTPFVLLFLTFSIYPILNAFYLSTAQMESISSPPEFVGLANFTRMLNDPSFWKALSNTVFYAAGVLLTLIPIPLVYAALLQSGWVKSATTYRLLLFTPLLTSLVVATIVFRYMLGPDGIFNSFLGLFNIPPQRLVEVGTYAMPICVLIALWRWTGMNIVYFQSGLNNIPKELFEAAAMDGAGGLQAFFHITLPMLKPIIIFVVTISLIGSFQVIVEPYILYGAMAGPGESALTMVFYLYMVAFQRLNFGYAAAIGVALALIIMTISLIQFRIFGFFSKED